MIEDIAEDEPFTPFARWLALAEESEELAETMTLATVAGNGAPSLRAVLLKAADARGFVFYTNLESRKSNELFVNPRAALCFHWKSLLRQVRVEGVAEQVSEDEADGYFATRPRGSQIAAWASDQSRPLENREVLEKRVDMLTRRFADRSAILRPNFWSGFRVRPDRVEFWQDQPSRLHDRVVFVRDRGAWRKERLFPVTIDTDQVRLRSRATYASVAVSLILIVIKFAAWLATGSVAMLSSLVDSMLDIVAAVVNVFAVRQALEPADREHRFGHGKAEPLAALGQSAFLAGGAILLVFEAVSRGISPEPIMRADLGIAVMVVSMLFDGTLVLYQRFVVARTRSLAVSADELHFRSDLVVNAAVLAALIVNRMVDVPILDPIFGGLIGLWIIYGSTRLLRRSLTQLMDHEMPDQDRAHIRAIAEAADEVTAVHDLKTRLAGPTAFIQLHLEMDGAMELLRAHRISDEVEAQLRDAYPNAEIIIHQDPAGLEEARQAFPPRVKAG